MAQDVFWRIATAMGPGLTVAVIAKQASPTKRLAQEGALERTRSWPEEIKYPECLLGEIELTLLVYKLH